MPSIFSYPITFLPTTDLEKTKEFYGQVLNMPIALDQGQCVIFRVGEYGYWGFCEKEDTGILNPDAICLTLVVETPEEVDDWHEYLMESNIQVKRNPQYTPQYKIYNGFYLDPMGYTIEIQAFDDESRPVGAEQFV